ncbi:Putative multidrug export ATP-binding/permease protein [Maioricimonas rarisocia]|uniref:Multidrug export ATP-binding/permease protein n=1 Tax=Maioricimonas rarisocia TaxID=2528026 RepID=A0A517Z246_9PLAN|nr:ABC transporter ATP-binding protein [Maioricimonas rarisocia]QDU36509.1 Putative multidrug export ATP-binding/permease protein [Maioricimonas rarisocia]
MESFKRLIPCLWPHRRRLTFSIVFGLLVAFLWGANISAVYPAVMMLVQGKDLHQYVTEEVEQTHESIRKREEVLELIDERLADLEAAGHGEDSSEYMRLLGDRVKNQRKLHSTTRTLWQLTWLQNYLMPWIPRDRFDAFALILFGVLAATAIKGLFIFVQDVLVGGVVQLVVRDVRKGALDRVLALDYQTVSADGTGSLMSRFTYDVEQLSVGLTLLGGRLVREPLKCLSCLIFALFVNWRLTLLSLLFLPLLGLALGRYGRLLKRASRRMMESMSRIYKVLEETFEGLKVVIAFGNEQHHRKQFDREYDTFFAKAMKVVYIDAVAKPSIEVLGLLAIFVSMLPGAYLVLRGQTDIWGVRLASDTMDPEHLALLYGLLVGMLDPCRKLSNSFSRLKRSSAAIDRIFSMMEREPLVREVKEPRHLKPHTKTIEFDDVTFAYPTRELDRSRGPALRGVNLTVEAGEVVALVGQNGCGKSTLVNLLPRLYDPQGGEIRIDGIPVHDANLRDLRSQIGIVTQETILFDDSIYENILYGKPTATRTDVEEAARRAYVMPIVETVPHGFETRVGEKGKELSGGQRQRIAMARAILRDPSILILDEATSAADAESAKLIYEALKSFVPGRTAFIITHSMTPALLDLVTRVVVMDQGQVVASGTHESLLQSCPTYARLYHTPSLGKAA